MSKKARAKKLRKAKKSRDALLRAIGVVGGVAGVLALGATGVMARGALTRASRDLGRSIEIGLARVKRALPLLDRESNGVTTSRGLS